MIKPPRTAFTPRRCVTNKHAWHALCACEGTAVCLRCGLGMGTVPCACMMPRWGDAELVRRTMEREARDE